MTQVETSVKSGEKTEDQLWTDFMVLQARQDSCWQLEKQSWCEYVRAHNTAREDITRRVWSKVCNLHDMWQIKRDAAYVAWKKVAYPLYGWPLNNE